jgi:hypothetical protein
MTPPLPPFAGLLGPPIGGGRWACPHHGGTGPNFSVRRGADGRERARCWVCAWSGDVIDHVMAARQVDYPGALEILGVSRAGRAPREEAAAGPRRRPSAPGPAGPPDDGWCAIAEAFVAEAVAAIWSPRGRAGLEFLAGRGLEPHTIRDLGIGYSPAWREFPGLPRKANGRPVTLPPGVVFAWRDPASGAVGRVKVRSIDPGCPKSRRFAALAGGGGCPYYGEVVPGRPLIIAEGEIDCALIRQAAGDRAGVVTLGSASVDPPARALGAFLASPLWLIATDADEAGEERASRWMGLAPRAGRVRPPVGPPGKDWGDALAAGWDLSGVWASAFNAPPGAPVAWGDPRAARSIILPAPGPLREAVLALGDDELELWEERAAILEFDGDGMPRAEAERIALGQVRPDATRNPDRHP